MASFPSGDFGSSTAKSGFGGAKLTKFGGAAGSILGAVGDFAAAGGYKDAAEYATKNAELTRISTNIREQQLAREIYQVAGAQQAATGAAGFSLSGSAIDLMRSSSQQGSLDMALISNQGLIEENAYRSQAAQYEGAASASTASGIGGIIGGAVGLLF